jgi:hypothetical protein
MILLNYYYKLLVKAEGESEEEWRRQRVCEQFYISSRECNLHGWKSSSVGNITE